MADDEDQNDEVNEGEDGEEEGDDKAVGGKKKLLLIIIVLLLLIGGGAGAFFAGVFGGGEEAEAVEEQTEEKKSEDEKQKEGEKEAAGPVYYELPDFIVNLNSGSRRTSFLKMKVTLEIMGGPEALAKVEAQKPRIMDAFNTYLRELRTSDLSGSAGIYRLREELLLRVNKALEPDKVKDILFNELIVQ